MKFLSFLVSLTALSTAVSGSAIPNADDAIEFEAPHLEKRAFLPIVGAPGAVKPRFEVRQLKASNANQWTLFMLAMRNIQARPDSAKNSFFQIAGIHGVPSQAWDDVGKCSTCTAAGYCPHSSILFLGWHRAYVALLEQEMIKVAKNIAGQYPQATRAAMQTAAANMRLPYWDWAAHPPNGGPNMPPLLTDAQVTVNGPTGSVTFANPLHHYTFKDPSKQQFTPWVNIKTTLRYATGRTSSATSNEGAAISALDRIRANMQTQVYNMFSTCDEYVEVGSNAAGQSSVRCSNSIENIHNAIHNNVGGPSVDGGSPGGHMTFLSLAAFDPAFWVHHCNVDRLYALWQGIYPDSFSGSQVAPGGSFTIPKGSTQNVNSPLTPFHKNAAGDFWTATQLRDWKVLKYNYPEYVNSDGSKGAIASYVNKLYGPSATATAGSVKRDAIPQSQVASAVPSATADATPLKADNGSTFQYVANIATNRFALGGSYNIYLYNGAPSSEDPLQLVLDANLIGPMGVLAEAGMTGSQLVVTGSIPLTEVLQQQVLEGDLVDMTQTNVVAYLKANLVWRVLGPDGSIVDPDTVPDFEISVYSSTTTPATEFSLPSWSPFIPLAEITKSKAGGATPQSIEVPPESA